MAKVLAIVVALAALALGPCVAAEVPSGIGSVAFVRLGVDARVLGMGGAFAGVADGHPVPLYNPAALALAQDVDVGTMYAAPYGFDLGIAYQYASVVLPLRIQTESTSGLGVAVTWMSLVISDITIWDEDDPGSGLSFTATDTVYLGSVGVELVDGWCAGAAAKLYKERILEGRAQGFGVDLAILGTVDVAGLPVSVSLNSMDVGRTLVQWSGTAGDPDNYVPWVNKFGVSVLAKDIALLAAADFDWAVGRPRSEQVFHVGVEWRPVLPIAVRGGWRTSLDRQSTFSLGIGLSAFGAVSLDYAYVIGGELAAAHFASIHVAF